MWAAVYAAFAAAWGTFAIWFAANSDPINALAFWLNGLVMLALVWTERRQS